MASSSGTSYIPGDIPIDPVLLALDELGQVDDDKHERAQSSGVEEDEDEDEENERQALSEADEAEEDERQAMSDAEGVPLAPNDDDVDDAVFK